MTSMSVLVDHADRDPLLQAALGPALLETLADDPHGGETIRLWSAAPTIGFTGRDCASPAIAAAVGAAERHGFAAVRRGPGGRAAAYHRGSLCIDHVGPAAGPQLRITERFAGFADRIATALRSLGVPAQVGALPGEFCPGDYSVHDGAGHKLVGTAQRLTRAGWLFATVIVLDDPEPLREVLIPVYAAMSLDFDPATVGAVSDTVPGIARADIVDAVTAALVGGSQFASAQELPSHAQELARARLDRHRPLS